MKLWYTGLLLSPDPSLWSPDPLPPPSFMVVVFLLTDTHTRTHRDILVNLKIIFMKYMHRIYTKKHMNTCLRDRALWGLSPLKLLDASSLNYPFPFSLRGDHYLTFYDYYFFLI